MSEPRTGWPKGRIQWLLGTVLIFAGGVIFGLIWGQLWIGLILAAAISMGWLIAYESSRGRSVGIENRDDDGAKDGALQRDATDHSMAGVRSETATSIDAAVSLPQERRVDLSAQPARWRRQAGRSRHS
jgi:hypothetical protein